ncbi:DUF3953 domain-containing protein [Bacillus sp. 3103sda1]|uniref:DUF3953 domain-containing protein n=1 Tax=unclassified Bacillus (in: firmicutes) TaxID=185979 RepID=UPI0020A198BA|nr:DUF3953 domain-containing protein [Bacillus sp. 3103sda1]MCP1125689.1 DUF3953 domain-containing protein [Bacillus sp. 3103sda1]
MLKILRILFSTAALVSAICSFFFEGNQFILYTQIFLILTFLVWGISEIKEQRKLMGVLFLGLAIFILFVAVVKVSR